MNSYHKETVKIYKALKAIQSELTGRTQFSLANLTININGKDGLGGLIEEWFGVWAEKEGFNIENPKKNGSSQKFPDYYVWNDGEEKHHLEIKTFDDDASANFDIANFQSYCESLAENPERVYADYLIFAYQIKDGNLKINHIFLKKIWEITCASKRWPLKTQTKRDVIYNIRPSNFKNEKSGKHPSFKSKDEFINALFKTEEQYLEKPSENKKNYLKRIQQAR